MNTKRVIQYFATIAVVGDKKKDQTPGKMQVHKRDKISKIITKYTSVRKIIFSYIS